jgi:hypothetical protein
MRDIDALLNSLVSIDRNRLVAILSSEAEAARQAIDGARQRTASQRAKRLDAEQRAARLEAMLSFFQHGQIAPGMLRRDVKLCKTVEQKLLRSRQPTVVPVA